MKIILDEKLEDWASSRESGMLTPGHNFSLYIFLQIYTQSLLQHLAKHLMQSPSRNAPSSVYHTYLPLQISTHSFAPTCKHKQAIPENYRIL